MTGKTEPESIAGPRRVATGACGFEHTVIKDQRTAKHGKQHHRTTGRH